MARYKASPWSGLLALSNTCGVMASLSLGKRVTRDPPSRLKQAASSVFSWILNAFRGLWRPLFWSSFPVSLTDLQGFPMLIWKVGTECCSQGSLLQMQQSVTRKGLLATTSLTPHLMRQKLNLQETRKLMFVESLSVYFTVYYGMPLLVILGAFSGYTGIPLLCTGMPSLVILGCFHCVALA